jgi:phage protein D
MYLKIGGSNASKDIMDSLISIEVDDSLLLPDMFSIRLRDPSFRWSGSQDFGLGKAIEISARGNGSTTRLLSGEITAIEPEFSQAVGPTVLIRGYDQSHRLHRAKETKTYVQETDSDIAKKIARDCGLKAQVDSTREVHDYVIQDNQTDMEFLQDRAQRIGYRLYVEEDTLYFRPTPETEPQIPVLEWGKSLLDFRARMTTAQQVTEVTVRGWDPKTKKEIIGRATAPQDTPQVGESRNGGQAARRAFNIDSKEIVVNRAPATQGDADAMAQSVCDEIGNSFIQAEGVSTGNPEVKAGAIVELKGIGQRFSGRYRITRSVHRYIKGGYTTRFEVTGRRANTIGQLLAPKSDHKHSVVIGIVTNNRDPQGWGRVKVRFPTLPGNEESDWARLVSPMAGEGRGFEFIPEVNDEVVVAFEHDDSHRPFILGSLWNGKDKPPQGSDKVVNSAGKVEKRIIRSRSGHTITLDDSDSGAKISIVDKTEKNAIEIDSQNNAMLIKTQSKIEIETGTGDKVILDSSGIKVDAGQHDIALKAMNIKLEADMNIEVKAGMNTDIKGQMGATLEGGTTADVKGGAKVAIQGGIVTIN